MGSEMTVPTWEPEYTQLPIRLRSFRGDHFAERTKIWMAGRKNKRQVQTEAKQIKPDASIEKNYTKKTESNY